MPSFHKGRKIKMSATKAKEELKKVEKRDQRSEKENMKEV